MLTELLEVEVEKEGAEKRTESWREGGREGRRIEVSSRAFESGPTTSLRRLQAPRHATGA